MVTSCTTDKGMALQRTGNSLQREWISVTLMSFLILGAEGLYMGPTGPFSDPLGDWYRQPAKYTNQEEAICRRYWEYNVENALQSIDYNDTRSTKCVLCGNFDGPEPPKVLVVHVGKTCGSTVLSALENSGVIVTHLHMNPLRPILIEKYEYIFIVIRDPLQRTISAFHYTHPSYKGSLFHTMKFQRKTPFLKRFFSCFPDMDSFAMSLMRHDECGVMARSISEGFARRHRSVVVTGGGHLHVNTCAYLGGVMDALMKHKNTYVIRTESCLEDLNATLKHTGLGSLKPLTTDKVNSYRGDRHEELSLPGVLALRGYLELIGEYNIYRQLLNSFRFDKRI